VPDTLSVHLSRTELHAIESPSSFETTGPFEVEFRNHGRSSRVHCTVDDSLDRVLTIPETNRMVNSEDGFRMTVDVGDVDRPVTGELEIVTGYGAESASVTLTVTPPAERSSVESFDDTYGTPSTSTEGGLVPQDRDLQLLVGFAVGAGLLAIIAAVLISDPVVLLGTLAVIAGIVVAGFLLRHD
jgi:hypothetical protein